MQQDSGMNLMATFEQALQGVASSNPALTAILDDYTRYHAVLVMLGGLFSLALLAGCVLLGLQFRATQRQWAFQRRVTAALSALCLIAGLSLSLIVAANTATVLSPRAGFMELVQTLGTPDAGTARAARYQAFNRWLQSGQADIPALVQSKIQARLAWQVPKAALSSALLLAFLILNARLWPALVRRSRQPQAWTWRERTLLTVAGVTSTSMPILVVMVIANTQAAFAPLNLTLLYG